MAIWETTVVIPALATGDAGVWADLASDKIACSKSLETVSTPKTRLDHELDSQVARELKAQLPHDVSVAGPTLAAHTTRAALVDEYHLLVSVDLRTLTTTLLPKLIPIRISDRLHCLCPRAEERPPRRDPP